MKEIEINLELIIQSQWLPCEKKFVLSSKVHNKKKERSRRVEIRAKLLRFLVPEMTFGATSGQASIYP